MSTFKQNIILLYDNAIGQFRERSDSIRSIEWTADYILVYFNNKGFSYKYEHNKVIEENLVFEVDLSKSDVYVNNVLQDDLVAVANYNSVYGLIYRTRRLPVYESSRKVVVKISRGKKILPYLMQIASLTNNEDEKEEDEPFLASQIRKVILSKNSVLSDYLNGNDIKTNVLPDTIIFPFSVNSSQKKAVRNALLHNISIIQGPPGTGKTQSILNLLANLVYNGKSVGIVSNNNSAVENVKEKLDKSGYGFLMAHLGNKNNQMLFRELISSEYSELSTQLFNNYLFQKYNTLGYSQDKSIFDVKRFPIVLSTTYSILNSVEGYLDYIKNNIVRSLESLYGDSVPVTLLREHYRCNPLIIGFCNQKYYKGELVTMTERTNEKLGSVDYPVRLYRTAEGFHARGNVNNRQIAVIRDEILPQYSDVDPKDIGIISPYRNQANRINTLLCGNSGMESDTIHKLQGREKRKIIFSTVSNEITEFMDSGELITMVMPANYETKHGSHIGDLIRYIEYWNPDGVVKSKIVSYFDLLNPGGHSESLDVFKLKVKGKSRFDSENIIETIVKDVLSEDDAYSGIDLRSGYPLYLMIDSFC